MHPKIMFLRHFTQKIILVPILYLNGKSPWNYAIDIVFRDEICKENSLTCVWSFETQFFLLE